MFTIFVFLISVIALFLYLNVKKPFKYPPGPAWLPIVGNFTHFRKLLKAIGYHHLAWQELSERYGNIVGLKMGRNYVVTVFGAEAVKEVLTREEFEGRPDGYFFRLRTFGKRLGIVFSDGKFWQKQRKFSLQHLKNFGYGRKEMETNIQEEAEQLMLVLKKKSTEGGVFMHNVFDVSVLNVLWSMMAGCRFASNDKRLTELLQIIHDAFRLTDMSGGLLNQMPFLRHIAPDACGYTQILNILTRMWTFLQETILEHRRTVEEMTAPRDLIDAFLQKMNVQNDATFTDDQLMSLCLDLFMAGSETTSNTLSFAVVYMLEYPEVQKKVQEELDQLVGRNRMPNLADRINLVYTEAVLMEIQRRANIPPLGIAHRATQNTELQGFIIPEGSIVLTSLYSVHMDTKYWKDPLAFRPERFIVDEKISANEKYFAPFGYGKRRCLGESLAKASYFIFFTTLLHSFNLKMDKDEKWKPSLDGLDGVTISPKPFKAQLIQRFD